MTTTQAACDKCGELIEADRTKLTVECGSLYRTQSPLDLCPRCMPALLAWLAEKPGRE